MGSKVVVTGGIASGKSTVVGFFEELGYRVGSADDVAREVFGSAPVEDFLRAEFGDRGDWRVLARDSMRVGEFRHRLNTVMHPLIWARLSAMDVDILEVPLLIEACLVSRLGRVLVCECPLDVVRLRLIDRLGEGADLDGLLGSQVGLGVRRVFADEVLRTDLPLESVFSLIRPLALAWL